MIFELVCTVGRSDSIHSLIAESFKSLCELARRVANILTFVRAHQPGIVARLGYTKPVRG
jgi:hypothetical protein